MMDRTNLKRRVAAVKRPEALMGDPVVQAGKLWEQHCSWCPRCDPTTPGCELGRKAHDVYHWLNPLAQRRRAG